MKQLIRAEIDKLLWTALSDQLTVKQKKKKIANLLVKLKGNGVNWKVSRKPRIRYS